MIVIKEDFSITTLRKRLFAVFIAITFLFVFVLGRLFFVQVIWGDFLQEKAVDQWTREIPVVASRGFITDCNGVILAGNDDTYTVFVRKRAIKNYDETVKILSNSLNLSEEFIKNRLESTKASEITLKKQATKSEIFTLNENIPDGVYYSKDSSRVYPYNDLLSSVIGITSTDGKGQSGLELYYDKFLEGENGEILYETDIVGVEIEGKPKSYIPAVDGLNLKLTVDYEIQQLCESAMSEAMEIHSAKSAQMLVLDPTNGAIKALCTKPNFNLNEPPRDDLSALNKLSRNGLICDVYEPGSTFKILTAAANVEEYLRGNKNAFSVEHIFGSSRYRFVDGQRIKCWSNHAGGKHANLNLQGALENSCNPIFVDIAMSLGKTKMYEYINAFGYGSVTGVDFSGEAQGMVLPESAVLNVDLARIAFGQTIAVTGLQLACATASAVNGGYYYYPYLVDEIYDANGIIAQKNAPRVKNRTISEKASRIIAEMLEKVVSDGSGKHAYIEGYRVAGKTGTAQKYENGIIAAGKYVASFIGFFPADAPKYLALVVIDEPQGGYYGSTVAAPYAKQVFEGIIALKGLKPYV